MNERFFGYKYLFELTVNPYGKKYEFNLLAIERETLHYSIINDLNMILAWLGIDGESPLARDKCWIISKSKMTEFQRIIHDSLMDKKSLLFLERELDKDREDGEWVNHLLIPWQRQNIDWESDA